MVTDNSEFSKKLLATFRLEAQVHLDTIAQELIKLEKPISEEQQSAVVETIFREIHTLKGAARSVDLPDIEELCQALENVFSAAKKKEIVLIREVFDTLHESVSIIEDLLKDKGTKTRIALKRSRDLVQVLNNISQGNNDAFIQGIPVEQVFKQDIDSDLPIPSDTISSPQNEIQVNTVRISVDKLDTLMLQTEDLGDGKRAAAQRSIDLETITRDFLPWKRRWGRIRSSLIPLRKTSKLGIEQKQHSGRLSELIKIAEFLDYNADFVLKLETRLEHEKTRARLDYQFLLERTDNMKNEMMGLLMMPAGSMLEIFPRFVREFSHDKGKLIDLDISGSEIVIDRRILEDMKDAFIHLIRNAIDHGIETPDIRIKKGKNPTGIITIKVSYFEGNKVEILIADDGNGINYSQIREAAMQNRLITEEYYDSIAKDEILPLIFKSGLTTSQIITDSSGRGLGLAIVMEKVIKIGGTITTDTEEDRGTRFRIIIPSKIATFKGLVVNEKQQTFVFPMISVDQVVRINQESLKTVENQDVFLLENEQIPLVSLGATLRISKPMKDKVPRMISLVVVSHAGKRLGFSVDEIGYVQDVIIKGFGDQMVRLRNFSSVTVLGTGKVVPVLNISDLVQSAIQLESSGTIAGFSPEGLTNKKSISILVTDDSITSRMLLKNILESGGYAVETAVDGLDALDKLQTGSFDILVSDVDMPRMNGFILTEKIRSNKKFSNIPVILVTALDSKQDREWGIDVGANAYIVKTSFNKSTLLEVVRKLVVR